jgi:hypothetical protein
MLGEPIRNDPRYQFIRMVDAFSHIMLERERLGNFVR